jgi:hypothetical protein
MPTAALNIPGVCEVTFLAGDYSSKPQFSLTSPAGGVNAIIILSSGIATGLKLSIRSYGTPSLMQIRNAQFDDLTLVMESDRNGIIDTSTVNLKYGVQHSLNFQGSFTIQRSALTMNGPISYVTPAFALYSSKLSIEGSNVQLPVPFSFSSVPSIVLIGSTLEVPSIGIAPSITISGSTIIGLYLGFRDPAPELLNLQVSASTVDRRVNSSPNPLIPDTANIRTIEFTSATLYSCAMTVLASQALSLTFQGNFTDSPVSVSTGGPSLLVKLGGSFLQSIPSLPSDPPLVSVLGRNSETTLDFIGSTPTTFLRPNSTDGTNLCDLSVSQLQMTGTSTAYPSLDQLCVGGTVTSSTNMMIRKSILGVGTILPSLRGLASPSVIWILSSIEYSVDIVTNTSIQYQVTSPNLGIHRAASTNVSVSFASPQIRVYWNSSDLRIPNHPYPLIDVSTNTSSTASSTNDEIVLIHSGSMSTPLFWSFGALPTGPTSPTQPCPQPQPGPTFECINGHWQSDVTVVQPVIILPGSGQIIVNGNLTVNQSIIFSGPESTVVVNGCAFITSPITIVLTEGDLDRVGGSRELISQSGCINATDLSASSVSVLTPSGSCRTVTLRNVGSPNSLTVLFDVSTKGCSKKTNVVAIIVPVVVGVIVIAGLIASLIYWQVYKAKMNPKTLSTDKK